MRASLPSLAGPPAGTGDDGSSWLRFPPALTALRARGRDDPGSDHEPWHEEGAAGLSQRAPQDVPGPDTGYFFFFAAFVFVPFFFAAFFLAAM